MYWIIGIGEGSNRGLEQTSLEKEISLVDAILKHKKGLHDLKLNSFCSS